MPSLPRLIIIGPLLLGATLGWQLFRPDASQDASQNSNQNASQNPAEGPLPTQDPPAPSTPPLQESPTSSPHKQLPSLLPPLPQPPPASDPNAPCSTGCSIGSHELPTIDDDGLREQLLRFAAAAPGTESLALDTLLFHGPQTQAHLARYGAPALPADHRQFLESQLALTHVTVTFRIIDDSGVIHVATAPSQAELGVKRHLTAITPTGIATYELNGTVQRVGLHSLWSRW